MPPGTVPQPRWQPGIWSLCLDSPGWGRSGCRVSRDAQRGQRASQDLTNPSQFALPRRSTPFRAQSFNHKYKGHLFASIASLPWSFKSPWTEAQAASSFTPRVLAAMCCVFPGIGVYLPAALRHSGPWGLRAGAAPGKRAALPCLLPAHLIYRITTVLMTSLAREGCNAGLTAQVLPSHER